MNRSTVRSMLISTVALLPLLSVSALGAPETGTEFNNIDTVQAEISAEAQKPQSIKSYKASLQAVVDGPETQTLDWRAPHTDLRFDLSQSDIIEALSVTLSADPLPGVDPSIPLVLQFNGGKPVEIPANGRGFDSVIDLDRTRARESGNILRISYAARCDGPSGGYTLNLNESKLDVQAKPRLRRLQLREVEKRLASPTFAPNTIGLVAGGADQTKLQALAAQGIGLRMDEIPDFRLSGSESDFDLIMVPRSQLSDYTNEPDILDGSGPQIALSRTEPNQLFLTGDTQTEVMESVSAFASSFLPYSRRSVTSAQEVLAQNPLDVDRRLIKTKATLDLLSVQTGTHREYTFDVADPAASEGDLVLRLNRDNQTQKGTRLIATLNGVNLGVAKVRGRRKTVAYPIPKGLLLGTGNSLELTTQDANNRPRCGASQPFIAIAPGSELRLFTDFPTPASDLSRFAANGSLFSQKSGSNTVLVLPERDIDFTPALSVVARLAQASGRGWVDAQFDRGKASLDNRHVLLIEPYDHIERDYRLSAPRGLQSAWRGQGPNNNRIGSVEQFASLSGEDAVRQAAANIRTTGLVKSGGVAAIYPDDSGRLIGVISNTAGSSFASAMAPLASDMHWNGLKGAVTRWNENAVIMAQVALPMPELGLPDLDIEPRSLTQRAKQMAASLGNIDLPRPNIDGLGGWIDDRWMGFTTSIRDRSDTANIEPAETVVTTAASGAVDTGPSALNSNTAREIKQSPQGLQGHLDVLGAKTQNMSRELWKHLDVPSQDMKSARLGQAQIIPIALGLTLLFLMILVGMAFAAPAGGVSRKIRQQGHHPKTAPNSFGRRRRTPSHHPVPYQPDNPHPTASRPPPYYN